MKENNELSLDRKYRPTKLSEYVGNDKVKLTVKSAINKNRPQAILIYGESGCGKTTLARLIAKEYTCEDRSEDIGACDKCESCKLVDEYIVSGKTDNLTDIQEIDIAEQSGKGDLEGLLEEMEYPAFGNTWRVYIFDEIHMASHALQNRLLKITEEPPERVLFIFCTTNQERLLNTLKNRCQLQLHITKPKVKELVSYLSNICQKEDISYDLKGLNFIANHSDLCIRTSIMNLEQVIAEQEDAYYSSVSKVFETLSNKILSQVYIALKNKDTYEYIRLLHEIKSNMTLEVFLTELKNYTVRGIYTINGITQEGVTDNELITYRKLFGDMSVRDISYLLDKLLNLDMHNLELELLMLGYSGIERPKEIVTGTQGSEFNQIVEIENELVEEKKHTDNVIAEEKKEDYEKSLNNTGSLMDEVDLGSLLAMGGSLVEEK